MPASLQTAPCYAFQRQAELMQCQYLESVFLGMDEILWVDEEGMLKPWDEQRFFCMRHSQTRQIVGNAFAGRGIMSGREGPEIVRSSLTAEDVRPLVVWTDARQVVIPAMTVAAAEFDERGRLRPIETPQPTDGETRTYDYRRQPRKPG